MRLPGPQSISFTPFIPDWKEYSFFFFRHDLMAALAVALMTIPQSIAYSLLAGLPQLPSVYSPYGTHPELAKVRQAEVLRRMQEDGYITKDQVESAKSEPLVYRTAQKEIGFKRGDNQSLKHGK